MISLSVVIPAYNESESIKDVVGSIRDFMKRENVECEIIIVDDHSTDDTARNAKASGEIVITHPINRGYGASITTGIKKTKYEDVMIIDADGTYPVTEIKKLLPYLQDFDMVVGARQGKHYYGTLVKRLSRAAFYLLLKYVTGENVPDANSGLRIFKKSVAMKFERDFCSGFSFTTTLTLLLLANRHPLKFVPIEYSPRIGKSKVRYLRDTARTFQMLLENIAYYNPIKAFLPFVIISVGMFILFAFLYVIKSGDLFYGLSAVVAFFSSMLFSALSLVAYVVVKSKR